MLVGVVLIEAICMAILMRFVLGDEPGEPFM